jgi:tetratricopeptide (TPR) repeat protein
MRSNPKPIAYRHYLEGQIKLKNCDLPKLRRARAEFKHAIQEDEDFAPAHARIAQTLQLEWLMLGGTDPYILNQAKAEAEAAVSIDAGDGLGHWMSAVVALYQRDFDLSAVKFLEAETLNPNSADLIIHHGDALSHFGSADTGWEHFIRAIELNPFPPDYYWWFGASIAIRRREFAKGIELCGNMENDEAGVRVLAVCHGLMGNAEAARQYGRRLLDMYPGVSALQLAQMAPDRRPEDVSLVAEGFRLAGLA